MKKLSLISAGCLAMSLLSGCLSKPEPVMTLSTVERDIRFLASDELNGRGNFSEDIDKAADYIAKRFEQAGLIPLDGQPDYFQTITIYSVETAKPVGAINGQALNADNVIAVSMQSANHWQSVEDVAITYVGQNSDLRAAMFGASAAGGNQLIVVDPSHSDSFKGWQGYLSRPQIKPSSPQGGTLLVVLSDETDVNRIDVTFTATIDSKPVHNVVGVLPGKTQANEYVLFSGHYDHLGQYGEGEDNIYNGADDNASGTTAVLNLADAYGRDANNQRSVMFAAFVSEEIGGFGSKAFVKAVNPDDIVAMFNVEMIGKPSKFGAGKLWLTGPDKSNLLTLLNESLGPNQQLEADPYPDLNLFYRSDNATLARLGVPAHSFSSVQLDADEHYHKVTDDIDSLDLPSLFAAIQLLKASGDIIVNEGKTPSRVAPLPARSGRGVFF